LLDDLDMRIRYRQGEPIATKRRVVDPHLESAMLPGIQARVDVAGFVKGERLCPDKP
jgi:hypothetical protein